MKEAEGNDKSYHGQELIKKVISIYDQIVKTEHRIPTYAECLNRMYDEQTNQTTEEVSSELNEQELPNNLNNSQDQSL